MIEINREHKNNTLTIEFMEDLRRSLEAMEIDEYTKCVLMYPKKGEVFSVGSDLKSLYWAKKNKNERFINTYFKKLYDFQNFIASYHKPMISFAQGLSSKFIFYII
jgi:enoyl-CoA hydratase/carnithine racemase